MKYLRDPASIYEKSFALITAEADLGSLPACARPIAQRVIHACGMVEIARELVMSDDFVSEALSALRSGRPIIADSEMVLAGITRLPAEIDAIATLNDPRARVLARERNTTRSAAAVELWHPHLEGALVVIGNAPTALFALLETMDAGSPKPAAIVAFPVGFVGAAEAKEELARNSRGVHFLTLPGRRGGSAMAAAAVNALLEELRRE
ncbi:MAG: precorrin-8X methylmutase [Hyphomicrobiales bacterium]